ncbi:MAG: ATP-binding cassette domain-containing protein [Candidatus Campbellbacteria bacterium]|nr:ATP-binding cassette domain-containing protein [Candidatus Campbellbacteria bacterium]
MSGNTIIRFDEVDFDFGYTKPILDEVSFTIRRGSKIALMGQNGAGKSTLFKLFTGEFKPHEGKITNDRNPSIAVAKQVIDTKDLDKTVRDYFQDAFEEVVYDIDPRIDEVLEIVNLEADKDKTLRKFSGGQKARLLLAFALIQKPDIILLDEPTNNLDKKGIEHLRDFLKNYQGTCVVISHDAEFLNYFTNGVLYLDVHTHKVEQYVGNYNDVVKEISSRIAAEERKNAQLKKGIQEKKDKANFFASKGGQMRARAKKMRVEASEMQESKVEIRKEDKVIPNFQIPLQENVPDTVVLFHTISLMKGGEEKEKKKRLELHKGDILLLKGPNGIGKTTFLEKFIETPTRFSEIGPEVKIGYYSQDFSRLDHDATVFEVLKRSAIENNEEKIRATAAKFLIGSDLIFKEIHTLSEGQKGLVSLARLVLEEPALIVLDEPTNHINFRHLPIIAKAVKDFKGVVILVSHNDSFVNEIGETKTLDLETI